MSVYVQTKLPGAEHMPRSAHRASRSPQAPDRVRVQRSPSRDTARRLL